MFRILAAILLCVSSSVFAQNMDVTLRPNRGQWDNRIDYVVGIQGGYMYLEQGGFTYFFHTAGSHPHEDQEHLDEIEGYCVKSHFIQAQHSSEILEEKQQPYYRNYLIGSDSTRWKSGVYDVMQVTYPSKYPLIDLVLSTENQQAKYTWIVYPGADLDVIRWKYEGEKSHEILPTGELKITHGLGYFIEGKPIVWKLSNGKKVTLKAEYVLFDGVYSFDIQGDYSPSDTIVIDPSITFSSFTGSLADNWGFTAAPDPWGNLYAGGIVFGAGYPTTTGVVTSTYNGGTPTDGAPQSSPLSKGFDVGISKFNATGTAFIFSTYLGGSANETPHSIASDASGNMYLLGVTSSSNFPMLPNSYDNMFKGGSTVTPDNLKFNGTDIYVCGLNASGTTLIASTYVGGSGNDGISFGTLRYNYGDNFRGEIIVDDNFVYFSSVTQSLNFPVVSGVQTSLNGAQDAVLVKMPKNLSSIVWSTYYGGSLDETGNGLQLGANGSLYLVGGTSSSDLNLGSGGWDISYNGGRDGFLVRFNAITGAIQSGTYIGTANYDQGYFVQVDHDNDVYVLGQTAGVWTITNGCYGNPNSGQFIMKFNPTLAIQAWVTTVGAGTGKVEISPTAFLVSNCKEIYVSGWGGSVNVQNSQATGSSSNGFPVTPDAFQPNTNGSNFWIAVLSQNAAMLKYATYIGGTSSSFNHVDGGTSRFDKDGNIYHAVCGACGGNDFGFTTTPGVLAPTNPSPNCNLAAFKFSLNTIEALVASPAPLICLPNPVSFTNNSANGNIFEWQFGDGGTSNQVNPSHSYTAPGQYTVTLVVRDSANCYVPDTVQFEVNIGDFNGGVVNPNLVTCPNVPVQLEAFGGSTYQWQPANLLNNAAVPNPIATVSQNTIFSCIISDSCGVDTVYVQVEVTAGSLQISNDTTICIGSSVSLFTIGADQINWSPPLYLNDPTSHNPISVPSESITYTVTGTLLDGCQFEEQVAIAVDTALPVPIIPDSLSYCYGSSVEVTVSGATSYQWSPNVAIIPDLGPTVIISSLTNRYYYCDFTNTCGTIRDSVHIHVINPVITARNDTIVCPGESAYVYASGGVSYTWNPAEVGRLIADGSQVIVRPSVPTHYVVTGTDVHGCKGTGSVFVDLFPAPVVQANPDVYAVVDEIIELTAYSPTAVTYIWSPSELLSCNVCQTTTTQPNVPTIFTVVVYDENGCMASDQVHVKYDPLIYVPNTFTPNADGKNEHFFALGVNVVDFKMEIYNRWGELIYTGDALSDMWDGTYNGEKCPDGVYTWKIEYSDRFSAERFQIVGHVSLLR